MPNCRKGVCSPAVHVLPPLSDPLCGAVATPTVAPPPTLPECLSHSCHLAWHPLKPLSFPAHPSSRLLLHTSLELYLCFRRLV
jgi:hypothetical protein